MLTLKVDPKIFLRNIKAKANWTLDAPTDSWTKILLDLMRCETVDCSPPHGIAFNAKTGEITTQNTPEKLKIFRQVIEQLNRPDGLFEMPDIPRRTILIEARYFWMSSDDRKKLVADLTSKYGRNESAPLWIISPEQFNEVNQRIAVLNLHPFQRPRIQTGDGLGAEFWVGNKPDGVDFDCLPYEADKGLSNGHRGVALVFRTETIGNPTGPRQELVGTNQYRASGEVGVEDRGGFIVSTGNPEGSPSNVVMVIRVEIVTNASPALKPEDQVAHPYMTLVQSAKSARREGIVQAQAGRRRIIDELDRIRVDHFGPNDRWPLAQVVSKLNQLTAGLVSNSPDIHFFTVENADGLQPMINSNTSLPVRNDVTNGAKINSVLVSIDPPLKNVTLAEVLDTVVESANKPIQYSVSARGIVFSPNNNFQAPRLFSRTFNVRADVFLANLQKQTGSETNVAAALRRLFLTSGLDLTPPESVFYNNRLGLLFVRASEEDLTAAEKIVMQLNDNQLAPQIHIKARFVEVPKGTLNGYRKMLGFTNQTNDVGIMTAENAKLAMRALQSRSGFEELAAPQVTTISARQTEMRATRSIMDVTNFAFKETSARRVVFPQTNVVEIGPILDTIAIISPDGHGIYLKATASLTHFLGYDNTTNITVVYDKEGQKISLPTISPCFDIRRASAHVTLWDGQTLVLGLKNHFYDAGKEVDAEPDYFVKMDRTRGQPSEEDKTVLVFITATLVDPAGHRIHSDSDENAVPSQNDP